MKTTGKNVPFAIRLPSTLVELIDAFAKKTGKSTPDAVREGMERVFSNEYSLQVISAINDKDGTLKRVRATLNSRADEKRTMLKADYSALLHFWHSAYMRAGMQYANSDYVDALLEITAELFKEAEKNKISVDPLHCRSNLQLREDESIENGIRRVRAEFKENPSATWAEYLTRPLEGLSEQLHGFSDAALAHIFDQRIKKLLPVAMFGAEINIGEDILSQDLDSLLPDSEKCHIGGIDFALYSSPLELFISEGHFFFAFGYQAMLGLAAGIETGAFERMTKAVSAGNYMTFRRGDFEIIGGKEYFIKGTGGCRIMLSHSEFNELISFVAQNLRKPDWIWLINRYRSLCGDI